MLNKDNKDSSKNLKKKNHLIFKKKLRRDHNLKIDHFQKLLIKKKKIKEDMVQVESHHKKQIL